MPRSSPSPLRALLILGALALPASCSRPVQDQSPPIADPSAATEEAAAPELAPSSGDTAPAGAIAQPEAVSQDPAAATAEEPISSPGSPEDAEVGPKEPEPEAPTSKRAIPTVVEDLQRKIQPGGPPGGPGRKEPASREALSAEAEELARTLVAALKDGDVDGALALLLSPEQLRTCIRPGVRDILAGSLLSSNESLLRRLTEQLGGQPLEMDWEPGDVVDPPTAGLYLEPVRALSKGDISVETGAGVRLRIRLDQILYADGAWRILQLTTP